LEDCFGVEDGDDVKFLEQPSTNKKNYQSLLNIYLTNI
jgi:hypothetical protein